MELTIEVDGNVAEKLKLISTLGGDTTEDLTHRLSNAISEDLSAYLVKLTAEMLASVGVSTDLLTGNTNQSANQALLPPDFSMTTNLGDSEDNFDAINATSAGNLLDDEEDEVQMSSEEEAMEEDFSLDTADESDNDNSDEIADDYLSQPEIYIESSSPRRGGATVALYGEEEDFDDDEDDLSSAIPARSGNISKQDNRPSAGSDTFFNSII